jgi:hypothetical protein
MILMHDFHSNTAEALPELLRQLKAAGYKVVHIVPKVELTPFPNMTRCSVTGISCRPINERLENSGVRRNRKSATLTCARQWASLRQLIRLGNGPITPNTPVL